MKRWVRRGFVGLLCFATLIVLFYAVEDYRGAKAWESVKSRLEARGENLDFNALIPPPIPDDENFAATPLLAALFDYTREPESWENIRYRHMEVVEKLKKIQRTAEVEATPTEGDRESGIFLDLDAWARYYRGNPQFPQAPSGASSAETVLAALDKYKPELDELRAASLRPGAKFLVHYEETPRVTLPTDYLTIGLSISKVLALRSSAALQAGKSSEALRDLRVIWKFQQALASEPFLIAQYLNTALTRVTLQPVWEGLANNLWSPDELKTIRKHLVQIDFLPAYHRTLRGEPLGIAVDALDSLKSRPVVRRNSVLASQKMTERLAFGLLPNGWLDQNKAMLVSFYWNCLSSVDIPRRRFFPERLTEAVDGHKKASSFYHVFSDPILSIVQGYAGQIFAFQTMLDQAVAACALEEYKSRHGKYPETLSQLAPEFLESVPHDLISGDPLHYLPERGRYKIYSTGWDEKDGGENESGSDDVFWTYPQ
jgi:hypothetical protein